MRRVKPEELPALLNQGVKVVDVRPADKRHTPLPFPAEWVPLEKIQAGEHHLPKVPLLLVCERGSSARWRPCIWRRKGTRP